MNSISIIIPCFQESPDKIAHLTEHLLSVFHHQAQIIISDQSHDDRIAQLINKLNDTNIIYTSSPWNSRAQTMNHGAQYATGDLLLFLHADNTLPVQAHNELTTLDLTQYCGGGFLKYFAPVTFWTSVMSTWRNSWRRRSKKFFGDNSIFCSKKVWKEIWWYADMQLFEDVDFSDRLSKYAHTHHLQVYVSPYPTITSSRKYTTHGFWRVFWLQTKLIVLYKLSWYNDTTFVKAYYGDSKR